MKRLTGVVVCMGILFAIATVSSGEDLTGVIYLGGGASYTIPDFDDDWAQDTASADLTNYSLGLGQFEYDGTVTGTTGEVPDTESESDDYAGLFLRGGVGSTVMVAENVGLEAEVTYGLGTGDIDVAKMITATAGIIVLL